MIRRFYLGGFLLSRILRLLPLLIREVDFDNISDLRLNFSKLIEG